MTNKNKKLKLSLKEFGDMFGIKVVSMSELQHQEELKNKGE